MQIALVIADEIKKEKQKKTSKQSYSTNSDDVTMYSTIGAAIGLMDN